MCAWQSSTPGKPSQRGCARVVPNNLVDVKHPKKCGYFWSDVAKADEQRRPNSLTTKGYEESKVSLGIKVCCYSVATKI